MDPLNKDPMFHGIKIEVEFNHLGPLFHSPNHSESNFHTIMVISCNLYFIFCDLGPILGSQRDPGGFVT